MKAWLWFLKYESIVWARIQALSGFFLLWLVNVDQEQLHAAVALIPGFDHWWPLLVLAIGIIGEALRRKGDDEVKKTIEKAKK